MNDYFNSSRFDLVQIQSKFNPILDYQTNVYNFDQDIIHYHRVINFLRDKYRLLFYY
jgi:hypothetical protein